MDFPDNSFDLVWACESGEHMPDKKAYVDEMVRAVLRHAALPFSHAGRSRCRAHAMQAFLRRPHGGGPSVLGPCTRKLRPHQAHRALSVWCAAPSAQGSP